MLSINKSNVVRLQPRSRDWSQNELAEFYRVENALVQSGLSIYTDRGITDEGDPWFIFIRDHDDEPIIHFARLGSEYIIACAIHQNPARGRNFHEMIIDLLSRSRLDAGLANKSKTLFLHPSALLIIFVAVSYFQLPMPAEAADSKSSLNFQEENQPPASTNKSAAPASKKTLKSEQPKNLIELETEQVSALKHALISYFSTVYSAESMQVILGLAYGEKSLASSAGPTELGLPDILLKSRFSKVEGHDSKQVVKELPDTDYVLNNIYTDSIILLKIVDRLAFHDYSNIFENVGQNEDKIIGYNSYLMSFSSSDFYEAGGASSNLTSRNLHEEGFDLSVSNIFILLAGRSTIYSEINEPIEKNYWSAARGLADPSGGSNKISWTESNGNLASYILNLLKFNPYQTTNSTSIAVNELAVNPSRFQTDLKEFFIEPSASEFPIYTEIFTVIPVWAATSFVESLDFSYAKISVYLSDASPTDTTNLNHTPASQYAASKTELIYYTTSSQDDQIARQAPDFRIYENEDGLAQLNETLRDQIIEPVDDPRYPSEAFSSNGDFLMEYYVTQLLEKFLSINEEMFFRPIGEDGFMFQTKTAMDFGLNGKMLINFYDGSFIEILGQRNEILNLLEL